MTTETTNSLSRPPTSFEYGTDWAFRRLALGMALMCIGVVLLLVAQIAWAASPAIRDYGAGFLTNTEWNARDKAFGIGPQICGTLYSSILGVGLGALFGVAVAIFLTQDFLPYTWEIAIKNTVELLAAIPSVVYGLWGIFVLIPLVRPVLCNFVVVGKIWPDMTLRRNRKRLGCRLKKTEFARRKKAKCVKPDEKTENARGWLALAAPNRIMRPCVRSA